MTFSSFSASVFSVFLPLPMSESLLVYSGPPSVVMVAVVVVAVYVADAVLIAVVLPKTTTADLSFFRPFDAHWGGT